MKSQQQHVSEDDRKTILALNSRASNNSVNGGENADAIPVDLVFEILLKLPTKSIARCRCVSKLWSSILLRPDFTEFFLTRSSTRPLLLFYCIKFNGELFFFTAPQVQNPDQNTELVPISRGYYTKVPFYGFLHNCGHVRGLVCLTHLRDLDGGNEMVPMIFKPSTGQTLPLPELKTTGVHVKSFLVYDPIGKLLKLLSMTLPRDGRDGNNYMDYYILILGTQSHSWRMIDCCIPHHPISINHGICIDGCLYYQAIGLDHGSGIFKIVCFDIRSETFRFVKKDMPMNHEITLVNYEGRLGALKSDRGGYERVTSETRSLELWVLVDPEKHEWSKLVYVLPPMWKNVVAKAKLCIVGRTSTYDIVLARRCSLDIFYYNTVRNTIKRVEFHGMDVLKHCRVDHTFLDHVEDVKFMQL